MENVEPFECCPSIGRHVSYTHVPKQNNTVRTKSANPVDKVAQKLSRRIVPLKPFGDVLFKALDEETKKRNVEAATVSRSSIKPYTKWLDEWEPGDPLPLIPPGFGFNLCDDISGGRLVNRDKKKKPRIGPLNDADLAMIGGFDEKSLGPKIKDSVYSLLSMVAKARGLWVDDKNKLRCPPGTPNANQFTDITGSNCFIPVAQKPAGAVSSGARAARRAAAAGLQGAMNAGARDYPSGFGGTAFIGARENFDRGRSMIIQSTATAKDFKQGLFRLPSGQAVTHFRQNAQGRANFLLAVQELMPNVDLKQAAEFWDNMLDGSPLTSLQKAQMEDYIESFFQSWFMEAKENPQKARWITHMRIGPPNGSNAWEINLRGVAASKNNKGQTVYDANMPISQSGFEFSMMFNPVAAYYLAKGDGNDKRHTGHGSQINMRSQGLYTGTHEFGHAAHFGQAMQNMGFDPASLPKGKNGEWLVDLRNMQNPTNNPDIARLQAMVARIESFQSGSRWQTLPSGQRVRVYAKDVKAAVTEFYGELYDTMTKDVGGTEEDFKLLARVVGANYAHSNYLEARAEAYAVIRHFGPQGIANFAREHAAYQASNPGMFPSPEPDYEIQDNVYSAMNRIFGLQTPDWWHSRNNALSVNTLTGGSVTPTGSTIPPSPPTRASGLGRFIPSRTRGGSGPGLSGPMSPRRVNGSNRADGLTGAISSTQGDLYRDRPKNSDTMPLRVDAQKAISQIDTDTADMLASAGIISDSIDISDVIPQDGVLIEAPEVFEKMAEQAGAGFIHSMNQTAYVDGKAMIRRASGTQITHDIDRSFGPMRDPRNLNHYVDYMNSEIEFTERKVNEKTKHIADIKALQVKIAQNKNDPDLEAQARRLSYHGMTLDETLKKLESRKRLYKKKLDTLNTDIDRLMSGRVEEIAQERKGGMQSMMFAALSAIKRVTERYPRLKGVLVSLDKKGSSPGSSAAGYAGMSIVGGRLVPNFKLNPPDEFREDLTHPDLGIPGNAVVGDFPRSSKLRVASVVYHELGHNLDAVAQLDGLGLKTGVDSAPVIQQLRSAGPDLGDSVVGTMYSLATGRALTTKLDEMTDDEKSALLHFVGWGLGVNGQPRESMNDGGRVRALTLSGVQLNRGRASTQDVEVSRTPLYQIMDVGTTSDIPDSQRVGGPARVVKGKEKDVARITTRINQIVSDALGWDFNNGVFGTAQGLLDSDGIVAESSKYAKTLRTERLAEGFTLMMLLEDYAPQGNGPDTVRPRQAATGLKNLIAGLPSRDSVVGLNQDQKDEIAELVSELHGIVEFPVFDSSGSLFDMRSKPGVKTQWRLANAVDLDQEISDTSRRAMGLRRYSEETTVEFATEKQMKQASPDGLTGAMAIDPRRFSGFETDQGSRYTIEPSGQVTRFKPTTGSTIEDKPVRTTFDNTVFVSTEDLQALKVSFDRGVGIAADGKIVGLDYDDSSVNRSTFMNLRKQGKPFDEAFRLAGGVISEREITPQTEPSIGLHPFEWNNDGAKHHAGNAIVGVTQRIARGQGLTGAMTAAKDFPDVPNPRMPKEAREGEYAYFPRGVWREEIHFPMADIIRRQFNTPEYPEETVAETYERISAYWGISPREVQRHVNQLGQRIYYDEPFVLPPGYAGVKYPNRRRKMTERSAPASDGLAGAMATNEREWSNYGDFYDILGVSPNASQDEIERAYKAKARTTHPDINKSPNATEEFQNLQKAHEVLSDPSMRSRYNRWSQRGGGFVPPPSNSRNTQTDENFDDEQDPMASTAGDVYDGEAARRIYEQRLPDDDWPDVPFNENTVFPSRPLSEAEFNEWHDWIVHSEQPKRRPGTRIPRGPDNPPNPREEDPTIRDLKRRAKPWDPFGFGSDPNNPPRPLFNDDIDLGQWRVWNWGDQAPDIQDPNDDDDSGDGLSGRMSAAGTRMTRRQTEAILADERHSNAEARVKNLRKAIDELENTGNWRGGDFGVVLGENKDMSADDIDAEGITPQNRSAEELAAAGRTTDQILAQAREKLRKAEDEVILQKHLADSKKIRLNQNVLDIEDIDESTFEQLKKEQADLIRLRETDRKAFNERFSTGKEGEVLVVHSGAAELDGGVLDPDKTQGRGYSPGSPGDTQALNQMQMQRAQRDPENAERLARLQESPRSGFLSSYPVTEGVDSRGYFARYADRVIPSDSSGWLKARWNTKLRGTAWLVSGKSGTDIVSDLGPGDERQILGVNTPLFGLSANRNAHAKMDDVSLAIMARAAALIQAGRKPHADEILGDMALIVGRIRAMKASGLSVEEIAKRLDVAESTIYARLGA